MTAMQWRIWTLATAGKFFEGLVVFMTGVALPLIVKEFGLGAMEKGAVGAAPLFGILIGATALGGLSDHVGRKRMFIVEMILFAISLLLLVVSPNYPWLLVFLFIMGAALGCDYPTAHMVISESIPSVARGKLILSAFGFQAVGALVGTGVGYLILYENPDIGAWRWMYATGIIPAILVGLRPALYSRQRALAAFPGQDRRSGAGDGTAACPASALSPEGQTGSSLIGWPFGGGLWSALFAALYPGDHLCLRSLVSPGSGDLRYRHLYTHHPCHRYRCPNHPRP
jgi:MFS family permease